jgi:hypothetical protein
MILPYVCVILVKDTLKKKVQCDTKMSHPILQLPYHY